MSETGTDAEPIFEHVEGAGADVPDFINRVITELLFGTNPEDFEFEGIELAVVSGTRFAILAHYDPTEDPQAAAVTGEAPPAGTTAGEAWAWMQDGRRAMDDLNGLEPHPLEMVVEDGVEVPATIVDLMLLQTQLPEAELWHDGLRTVALITGWTGEPGLSPLMQLAMWIGYEPQHEPSGRPDLVLVFSAEGAPTQELTVDHAAKAYDAFEAYFAAHGTGTIYTIDRPEDRQLVVLDPVHLVLTRVDRDTDSTQYMKIDRADQCVTAALHFFENGYEGLSGYGMWVDDRALLDGDPAVMGQARAAAAVTDAQAYEEIGRLWADAGFEDPSGQYLVFFEGVGPDEKLDERAELVALVDRLGLDRQSPPQAGEHEVWVRYNDQLNDEIAHWA